MLKRLMAACIVFVGVSVEAAPIVFQNVQLTADAVSLAEGIADAQSAASPPSPPPLTPSAAAIGASDLALAGAVAAPGLLSTSADVISIVGPASAVASASFSATFVNFTLTSLVFDFDSFDFATGSGFAGASLIVLLTSGGQTIIDEVFTVSTERTFTFNAAPGTLSLLQVFISSEASALLAPGGASNFASVSIVGTGVPLPSTIMLLLVAAFAMRAIGGRAARSFA